MNLRTPDVMTPELSEYVALIQVLRAHFTQRSRLQSSKPPLQALLPMLAQGK